MEEGERKMAEMSVRSILKRAGATKHYLGIEYLIEALNIMEKEWSTLPLTNLSKSLYHDIAQKYCTSKHCIERDIRTLINTLWTKGDITVLNQIFQTTLKKCPSNSEFIYALWLYSHKEDTNN